MDSTLLKQLEKITPEEQAYQSGQADIDRSIYTSNQGFEIDSGLFLKEQKLVTVRPHTRFVDFPEHKHNYVEIVYICKGSLTHRIDGRELVMHQGDLLFLNQHVRHSVCKASEQDIGINFIALPEFFDIPLQMLTEHNVIADFLSSIFRSRDSAPFYLLFKLENHRMIENLIENMIWSIIQGNGKEDIINQYSMGMIFLYLLNHMESLEERSSQGYKDIVVQATLKYINSHYKDAGLSKVAADFHMSVSHLSKIMKAKTGYTFQEHLLNKRFQKALLLLEETDMSVEEIAGAVGYENFSFFFRQFRNRFGMTPKKYRTMMRAKEAPKLYHTSDKSGK